MIYTYSLVSHISLGDLGEFPIKYHAYINDRDPESNPLAWLVSAWIFTKKGERIPITELILRSPNLSSILDEIRLDYLRSKNEEAG